jgi:hypothetical protein
MYGPTPLGAESAMYSSIGGQQEGGNFAVFTGPVEQNFLFFGVYVVRSVWSAYVLVCATGRIAEQKAFESLGFGGFVYWRVCKALLVQLDVCGQSTENSLDNFLAGLDRSADLFCK